MKATGDHHFLYLDKPTASEARLTVADVIDRYTKDHVEKPGRRSAAQATMRYHLGLIRRTEIPVGDRP